MVEDLSNSKSKAKRKKLTGFANWLVWSGITKFILIKKDI